MLAFQDAWSWTQIFTIVLLDLLLAGDNAIVIAMAVRLLPSREQRLGRFWGVFGAVALRVLFLTIAAWLLAIPWLQFAGGVLLLWIAYKLLSPEEHGVVASHAPRAEGSEPKIRAGESLRQAIWIIVIADASMSLDNVIAVTGAAEGHLGLAIGGVALSIPLVVWGSQLLSKVMANHRWVVWIGGGVLGHVAGVLMLEEHALRPRLAIESVNAVDDTIRLAEPQELAANTAVQFLQSSGVETNLPLSVSRTYYVVPIDAKTIKVSASPDSTAAVDLTDAGIATSYLETTVEHPGRHPLSLALGAICYLFGWWASRHRKQRAEAPAPRDGAAGTP